MKTKVANGTLLNQELDPFETSHDWDIEIPLNLLNLS